MLIALWNTLVFVGSIPENATICPSICYFIIINQRIIYKGWQYYFSFPESYFDFSGPQSKPFFRTETICLYSQALRMIYYIIHEKLVTRQFRLFNFFKPPTTMDMDMFPDKSNVTWWTINLLFIFLFLGNNTRSARHLQKGISINGN